MAWKAMQFAAEEERPRKRAAMQEAEICRTSCKKGCAQIRSWTLNSCRPWWPRITVQTPCQYLQGNAS
ncbi:hypothetical protein ABBQ38_009863 [Trebouxia sp. C0009 RCD-2024]